MKIKEFIKYLKQNPFRISNIGILCYQWLKYDMVTGPRPITHWPDLTRPCLDPYSGPAPEIPIITGPLQVPRWYSSNKEIRNQISETVQAASDDLMRLASHPSPDAKRCAADRIRLWMENCTGPRDGGTLWMDRLMGCQGGDTAFTINTRFLGFVRAFCILDITGDLPNGAWTWLRKFVDFSASDVPQQINNHYAVRANFLCLAGAAYSDQELWNRGVNSALTCFRNAFDDNWDQPFELARGDSAREYSRLNLLGLVGCYHLIREGTPAVACAMALQLHLAIRAFEKRFGPDPELVWHAFGVGTAPTTYRTLGNYLYNLVS